MSERQNPLYRILSHPRIYQLVQRTFGADAKRKEFVEEFVKPRPGDRLLDVGCGPADILHHLPDLQYIGIEPNAAYVERARNTFGDRGTFHVGLFDAKAAASIGSADIALVSAVLHHLDDEEAADLFRLLATVVKPGGRVVTLDPVFVAGQSPLARRLISMDRGKNVRSPAAYMALARQSFRDVAGTTIHHAFPPYTHWIMTATQEAA